MFPDENKVLNPGEGERIEKPLLPQCLWKTVVLQQGSHIKMNNVQCRISVVFQTASCLLAREILEEEYLVRPYFVAKLCLLFLCCCLRRFIMYYYEIFFSICNSVLHQVRYLDILSHIFTACSLAGSNYISVSSIVISEASHMLSWTGIL